MADQSSRSEQATPKRLQKARKEGRFAVSRQLAAGVHFLLFVTLLSFWGGEWMDQLKRATADLLRTGFHAEITAGTFHRMALDVAWRIGAIPAKAGAVLVVGMLVVQLASTRLGISAARLKPDLQRLNPVKRFSDLFRQNLPSFVQALVLMPVFLAIAAWLTWSGLEEFLMLPLATASRVIFATGMKVQDLLWKAAFAFALIGLIDLVRERRRYARDLRMSKQEIREEMKESEGNPEMKSRIRRIQRDRARRRMMHEIPTATAVVVNPTHYAVAIRYDLQSMAAPLVVAKGKNYLALRIRQRATEHQVPIVENPPLARALYGSVDVGQEIPAHLYRAVAEVLAYVFRLLHRS
jgi:flagellar biosynthetic protein FlhB